MEYSIEQLWNSWKNTESLSLAIYLQSENSVMVTYCSYHNNDVLKINPHPSQIYTHLQVSAESETLKASRGLESELSEEEAGRGGLTSKPSQVEISAVILQVGRVHFES